MVSSISRETITVNLLAAATDSTTVNNSDGCLLEYIVGFFLFLSLEARAAHLVMNVVSKFHAGPYAVFFVLLQRGLVIQHLIVLCLQFVPPVHHIRSTIVLHRQRSTALVNLYVTAQVKTALLPQQSDLISLLTSICD